MAFIFKFSIYIIIYLFFWFLDKVFSCLNHEHGFKIVYDNKRRWYCDGYKIYEKCKSKVIDYKTKRFKCIVCDDYDLCQLCFEAPLVENGSKKDSW